MKKQDIKLAIVCGLWAVLMGVMFGSYNPY